MASSAGAGGVGGKPKTFHTKMPDMVGTLVLHEVADSDNKAGFVIQFCNLMTSQEPSNISLEMPGFKRQHCHFTAENLFYISMLFRLVVGGGCLGWWLVVV